MIDSLPYQLPPEPIRSLVDVAPLPAIRLHPFHKYLLFMDRPGLPPIEELRAPEVRLAGLKIDPDTFGPSRAVFLNTLRVQTFPEGVLLPIEGLPEPLQLANISWSPCGKYLAFTNTTVLGISLWMVDIATQKAKALTAAHVNDVWGGLPYIWMQDALIYAAIPDGHGAPPKPPNAPLGPIVQSTDGDGTPNYTYQDLLKNGHDEALLHYYGRRQLRRVHLKNEDNTTWGKPGLIFHFSASPDGKYIKTGKIETPFSYQVPVGRFPMQYDMYLQNGAHVCPIATLPLSENQPQGMDAVRLGKRSIQWRADQAATLFWVEALDGGDPKMESSFRDAGFLWQAPFKEVPVQCFQTQLRFNSVAWGRGDLAIYSEWRRADRKQVTWRWRPDNIQISAVCLFDRSYEDVYANPGMWETMLNEWGRSVIKTDNRDPEILFLTGLGASPEGNIPFIDRFDLRTQLSTRIWQSSTPWYEQAVHCMDRRGISWLMVRESRTMPSNLVLRDLSTSELKDITNFENPYAALDGVQTELVRYHRRDGLELTATLYLPKGFQVGKDAPLPAFLWAYPREFKDAQNAAQVTDSPYSFVRLHWGSPKFWVARGYAILDDFSVPIIGEGDQEPNENFLDQLKMGAEAAVRFLVDNGYAHSDRLAIGGHSYGAFMVANLLAHTQWFAAGIARSGAYNRSLTPFGFQSEERTLWQAKDTYAIMSPFLFADQIKQPLLLIHGEADSNSGTYPMQSERFFAALKANGAVSRWVTLPYEDHAYKSRESIMHMLWEMDRWLELYVGDGRTVS